MAVQMNKSFECSETQHSLFKNGHSTVCWKKLIKQFATKTLNHSIVCGKRSLLYLIVCQKEVKVQYVGEKQYCTLKKRQYVEKKMKRKEQYIMSTEKVIVQYVEQKVVALGV